MWFLAVSENAPQIHFLSCEGWSCLSWAWRLWSGVSLDQRHCLRAEPRASALLEGRVGRLLEGRVGRSQERGCLCSHPPSPPSQAPLAVRGGLPPFLFALPCPTPHPQTAGLGLLFVSGPQTPLTYSLFLLFCFPLLSFDWGFREKREKRKCSAGQI